MDIDQTFHNLSQGANSYSLSTKRKKDKTNFSLNRNDIRGTWLAWTWKAEGPQAEKTDNLYFPFLHK